MFITQTLNWLNLNITILLYTYLTKYTPYSSLSIRSHPVGRPSFSKGCDQWVVLVLWSIKYLRPLNVKSTDQPGGKGSSSPLPDQKQILMLKI